jgi:hypothetical protein
VANGKQHKGLVTIGADVLPRGSKDSSEFSCFRRFPVRMQAITYNKHAKLQTKNNDNQNMRSVEIDDCHKQIKNKIKILMG